VIPKYNELQIIGKNPCAKFATADVQICGCANMQMCKYTKGIPPSADKLREKAGKTMVAKSAGRALQLFAYRVIKQRGSPAKRLQPGFFRLCAAKAKCAKKHLC